MGYLGLMPLHPGGEAILLFPNCRPASSCILSTSKIIADLLVFKSGQEQEF